MQHCETNNCHFVRPCALQRPLGLGAVVCFQHFVHHPPAREHQVWCLHISVDQCLPKHRTHLSTLGKCLRTACARYGLCLTGEHIHEDLCSRHARPSRYYLCLHADCCICCRNLCDPWKCPFLCLSQSEALCMFSISIASSEASSHSFLFQVRCYGENCVDQGFTQ